MGFKNCQWDHKFVLVTSTTLLFLFSAEVSDTCAHLWIISPLDSSSGAAPAERGRFSWRSGAVWSTVILSACLCLATSRRCAISSCVSGLNARAQAQTCALAQRFSQQPAIARSRRQRVFTPSRNVFNKKAAAVWAGEMIRLWQHANIKTQLSVTKVTSRWRCQGGKYYLT